MAKSIKRAEAATVQVNNISAAAMKVILSKMKTKTRPGPGGESSVFVKGPTDFAQSDGFAKFSRPGDSAGIIINVEGDGGFKLNADIVKDIAAGKKGM